MKNKDINNLYIKNEGIKFIDIINNFGILSMDKEFEIRNKKPLNPLKFKKALKYKQDYTPEEYSDYYYDYFIYEDIKKSKDKIIFKHNKIRKIILENIIYLRDKKDLKTFKFTGSTSTGKSF